MLLCYSALSPFCRKVRMVMEHHEIAFELFDSCDIARYPAYNPRAEIPILVHQGLTVVNSADILAYLDRLYPDRAIYPKNPRDWALVREWEREADTLIDAVVTDVAIYKWADLPPPPTGLDVAARRELGHVFDRIEAQLDGQEWLAGTLSVAEFALYPHLSAAQILGIGANIDRHPRVIAWLERIARTAVGRQDRRHVGAWWADRANADVDTRRINWGTHRLEWFLANGFLDHFVEEVRQDRVLWSVGPNSNARNNPLAPS